MRYYLLTILSLLAQIICAQVSHQFRNTPLIDAIRTIEQGQTEYTVSILSDGLADMRTSFSCEDLSVPKAVKEVCKDFPLKVKIKGRIISVQLKKGYEWRTESREVSVSGLVEDGFLLVPLPDARISIWDTDSTMLADSVRIFKFMRDDRPIAAQYDAKVQTNKKSLTISAQLKGYDDVWKHVVIGENTQVWVPKIQMRKIFEKDLSELVVRATRIKMFYKGDTLVYDATAFNLPDGSMLDDLIKQMPGVTMNASGEIFVNGRKVDELLLGSRSFMGGNKKVLMENLPYYTVKDIKVYEQQSKASIAMGYDAEPRKYVMDVNLKNEYMRGYIANIEAAAGTNKRFLGRAFLLGFSELWRYSVMANANNVNETKHISRDGHWTPSTMPQSILTTYGGAIDLDYQSKNKNIDNNLTVDLTSTGSEQETRRREESFIAGTQPVSWTESLVNSDNWRITAKNEFSMAKPMYLASNTNFTYERRKSQNFSFYEQWNERLTASNRTDGIGTGRFWSIDQMLNGHIRINREWRLSYHAGFIHRDDRSQLTDRHNVWQSSEQISNVRHNANDIINRQSLLYVNIYNNINLHNKVGLMISEMFNYNNSYRRDYLYHPDTLLLTSEMDMLAAITDRQNSYSSHSVSIGNNVEIRLKEDAVRRLSPNTPISINYERWGIGVDVMSKYESLNYQRGSIDTLITDTWTMFYPTIDFRHVTPDGKRDLTVGAKFRYDHEPLLNRIDFRDDSQPLVVRLANPDLKGTATTYINIKYKDQSGKKQQLWNLNAMFNYHHRSIAQSVSYNPQSGVYTYKPLNVNGAYYATTNFELSRNIDEQRYWRWQINAEGTFDHSVDHAMLFDETESHQNVVNTLTLRSGAYIQYNKNALNIRTTGDFRWRHSVGRMRDFTTLNAFDYQYGLNARYTIPKLKTTISVDGNMYSRRGYGSDALNTDDFVFNASVSQPFLKGKLIAKVEAFDLFHQLSSTQYVVNAQGRTETWNRTLPKYAMLHLVYHFNKNPKKR